MITLAQISPPAPDHFIDFLKAALILSPILLGIAVAWKTLFGRPKIDRQVGPQPFEVKPAETYVTEHECRIIHAGFAQRMQAMEDSLAELRSNQTVQIGRVHQRVDDMLASVSRLAGILESVQGVITEVHRQLSELRTKE